MNWGTLGHSKDLEPLLVRLYDSHRIYQLAEDRKPEARAELSHIVSGLLDMELKTSEKELIADILINLMRQAEKDLRCAVAERLSILENVPLRLVLFMAQDEIGVAETVLRSSPVLNDLDLLYIIQSRDSEYWKAIAARHKLNEPVIDALADTRDLPTVCTLAGNTDISLSSHALEVLSEIAEKSKDLARPLLTRNEIPESLARKLYDVVGNEMQKTMTAVLSNELSVLNSVRDILVEFSSEVAADEYMPTTAMLKAAEMFADKKQLTPALMMRTLKRGQISSFVAQISCYAKIRAEKVLNILRQENGQGLATICRVSGLGRDEFIGIYLLTNKMRGAEAAINHGEFNRAVAFFDQLGRESAAKLYAQYRL